MNHHNYRKNNFIQAPTGYYATVESVLGPRHYKRRNPWTAKDVGRHNKRCAARAKCRKKWPSIANAVLRNTGDEGRAIRIANWQTKRMGLRHNPRARGACRTRLRNDKVWVVFTEQRDAHDFPRLFRTREQAEEVLRKEGLQPIPEPDYPEGYAWTYDGTLRGGWPVWMLDLREIEGDGERLRRNPEKDIQDQIAWIASDIATKLPHLSVGTLDDPTEYVIIPIIEDCVTAKYRGEPLPSPADLGLSVEDAQIVYEAIRD